MQGLTVCVEEGKVTVARILIDSIIDKQGLLRPGDVIVEANGQKIKNPEQLQEVNKSNLSAKRLLIINELIKSY